MLRLIYLVLELAVAALVDLLLKLKMILEKRKTNSGKRDASPFQLEFRILQISIICDICMKDHKHTAIYNGMLL